MSNYNESNQYPELRAALKDVKQYFIYGAAFSAAINLLMLVPIIYMLQVYDRVISSGSYSTLAMLTLIMMFLILALGAFEWVRSMILISASNRIEKKLRARTSTACFSLAVATSGSVSNAQPLSDLSSLRQFMTGQGMFALFDAPWFPIYVFIMFIFHPWFGVAAIFSGIVMIFIAYLNEKTTTKKLSTASDTATAMSAEVSATLRNSEVIAAMGMNDDLHNRQEEKFDAVLKLQTEASKNASLYASIAKTFRVIMQSLLLGLGALLALRQEISPGMMIAGSLLLGRALAPIDMLVATWKGFSLARGQYFRLGNLLELVPTISDRMALPDPLGRLSVEKVTVVPPGTQTPVAGADFNLEPGTALAIIGPSGSGKSSLARTLLGIWPAAVGKVRLDGADIASWSRPLLGPHIGYLPQDIELFNGSIAENICRFGEINPDQTIVAAQNAGVHQLIQNLPQGYDTKITKGNLSGGQRQRIGLARAVYGNPRLVILDEPNSNLDEAGETELINAMEKMKGEGTTVIVITHRTSLLKHVDQILLMNGGANSSFGPRDSMIEHLLEKKKAQ